MLKTYKGLIHGPLNVVICSSIELLEEFVEASIPFRFLLSFLFLYLRDHFVPVVSVVARGGVLVHSVVRIAICSQDTHTSHSTTQAQYSTTQ